MGKYYRCELHVIIIISLCFILFYFWNRVSGTPGCAVNSLYSQGSLQTSGSLSSLSPKCLDHRFGLSFPACATWRIKLRTWRTLGTRSLSSELHPLPYVILSFLYFWELHTHLELITVAQTEFDLMVILLPQLSSTWDCRRDPPPLCQNKTTKL